MTDPIEEARDYLEDLRRTGHDFELQGILSSVLDYLTEKTMINIAQHITERCRSKIVQWWDSPEAEDPNNDPPDLYDLVVAEIASIAEEISDTEFEQDDSGIGLLREVLIVQIQKRISRN